MAIKKCCVHILRRGGGSEKLWFVHSFKCWQLWIAAYTVTIKLFTVVTDICPGGKELKNKACVDCNVGFYREQYSENPACLPCPEGNTTKDKAADNINKCSRSMYNSMKI